MALTVNEAFRTFLTTSVRLDSQTSKTARGSRDWLIGQLHGLADGSTDVPDPWEDKTFPYGSFARRTKIRELDDIDIILALKAHGATYWGSGGGTYIITVPETATHLRRLCNEDTDVLNSKKVINRIIKELRRIPQYSRSDIKRNESAAVLDLSSYTWSFDIVPAFFTTEESDGRTYYLIPDGKGSWMKTDPRIDQANVTSTNQHHLGHLLDLIRLVKYWNRRQTMPTVGSYLLECFVLEHVQARVSLLSEFPDLNFRDFLDDFQNRIFYSIYDPKGIDGDINDIDPFAKMKICEIANRDLGRAADAISSETNNQGKSISLWGEIFGDAFPAYSH